MPFWRLFIVACFLRYNIQLKTGGYMDAYSSIIHNAVEAAGKSVVKIERLDANRKVSGTGSGFFFSSDGYLFTNSHVVHQGHYFNVMLHDGSVYPAILSGEDTDADIAILKTSAFDFQ